MPRIPIPLGRVALTAAWLLAMPAIALAIDAGGRVPDVARPPLCAAAGDGTAVTVVATTLAGVPAHVRIPAQATGPVVVLWHGLGPPASGDALMALLPLDDVPSVKVYPDLPMLGTRTPLEPDELLRRQGEDLATGVFEPVVLGAARELAGIVEALRSEGCLAQGEAVDLFGFSAGGAAVLHALAERDVPVRRAAVLNASTGLSASVAAYERVTGRTYAWTPQAHAIARASDGVSRAGDIARGPHPPVVRIIHGADDAMLATADARALHEALAAHHAAGSDTAPDLVVVEGLAHAPQSLDDIATVRDLVASWLLTEG